MARLGRRWSGWAAWLGVIALGLNLLVPVHLAFDLAEALEPLRHAPAAATGAVDREILGYLCGHEDNNDGDHHGDRHGKHSHSHCPVCVAVTTLVALTPPAAITLPAPTVSTAATLIAAAATQLPLGIPAAAYQSRAPPFA